MKSEHDAPPNRPDAPPALTGAATVPVEFLGPLLADFPDPVVVTNRDREVVFLNGAAQKLFGEALRAGDPCPSVFRQPPSWAESGRMHPGPPAVPSRGRASAGPHSAEDALDPAAPPSPSTSLPSGPPTAKRPAVSFTSGSTAICWPTR